MSVQPVRLTLGWAFAWLDGYQAPVIVTEGICSEIKGFFREIGRGKTEYPHNHVNPQTNSLNRLGRKKKYCNNDDGWRFA